MWLRRFQSITYDRMLTFCLLNRFRMLHLHILLKIFLWCDQLKKRGQLNFRNNGKFSSQQFYAWRLNFDNIDWICQLQKSGRVSCLLLHTWNARFVFDILFDQLIDRQNRKNENVIIVNWDKNKPAIYQIKILKKFPYVNRRIMSRYRHASH